MILELPDLPTERAELADWLERRIVEPGLRDLAVALVAIGPDRDLEPKIELEEAFAGKIGAVLRSGLSSLSEEELRTFLRRPELLLALQERVLFEGGPRWMTLLKEATDSSALQRIAHAVGTAANPGPVGRADKLELTSERSSVPRWVVKLSAVLAVAATVALVVSVFLAKSTTTAPWTFPKEALAADVSAKEYLERLADAFEASAVARPTGPDATHAWLQANIDGCDSILMAPHEPLKEEDRDWLIERCRIWRQGLSAQLTVLEEDSSAFADASSASQDVLRRSVRLLRERAAKA